MLVAALSYAAAAAVTAVRPLSLDPAIRTIRSPGFLAGAAVLGLLAVLPLAGIATHPAALLESAVLVAALLLGSYGSETLFAPLVLLSTVVFVLGYARTFRAKRRLGAARAAVLASSALLGIFALIVLQREPPVLYWQKVRSREGRAQVRTYVFEGTCGSLGSGSADPLELDAGCDPIVPRGRARLVIALAALCAVSGVCATAGAGAPREPD